MVKKWKVIKKAGISRAVLEPNRTSLAIPNPVWAKQIKRGDTPKGNILSHIICYTEDQGSIYVPRYFSLSRFPLENRQYLDRPIKWPATKWKPRPEQLGPIQALRDHKEGVVVLPCGSGKTVLTLLYLGLRGQKALAVSPTETVRDQWCEYFEFMYLEGWSHPVSGKNWKTDSPLSSVTLQQIALHPPPPEFFQQFGVVIFDEVDVANAAQLSQALRMFNAERIGLTATKARDDRMDVLTDLHIGPVIYRREDVPPELRANIYIVRTGFWMSTSANLPLEITRVSMLTEKMERVFSTLQRAIEKGRKICVLCERIEQAEMYYRHALKLEIDCTLAHSDIQKSKRDYSRQVIFATNLIGRGFNCEELDTILVTGIFSYSAREFKQLLGRLQRSAEKKRPTVVIYLDRHPQLAGQLRKILAKTKDYYSNAQYLQDKPVVLSVPRIKLGRLANAGLHKS